MAEKPIGRYNLLDAFRGLAILWIVCFHVLQGDRDSYGGILSQIINHGHLGVSVFFVISGYSISASIFRNRTFYHQPYLFLIRRLRRIYFCYWWHLLFAVLIFPVIRAIFSMLKSHSLDVPHFHYSISEWLQIFLLTKVFTSDSWMLHKSFLPLNGPLWYIAIIVQIYLFVTFCLYFKKRAHLILFLGFVASLSTYIPTIANWCPFGLFLPLFSQFYIGIIIFYLIKMNFSPRRKIAQLTAFSLFLILLTICFIYNKFVSFSFALVTGSVIFILYDYNYRLNQLLLVRLLGLIGGFSYSLYLIHIPLWPLVEMFVRNLIPLSTVFRLPLFSVPILIILSFIWYLFFEHPDNQRHTIKSLLSPVVTIRNGLRLIRFKTLDRA